MDAAYSKDAPEHNWEIDPSTLEIGPKVGQGEFGSVHKARLPAQKYMHVEIDSLWQLHFASSAAVTRLLYAAVVVHNLCDVCPGNCCVMLSTAFERRLDGWALL